MGVRSDAKRSGRISARLTTRRLLAAAAALILCCPLVRAQDAPDAEQERNSPAGKTLPTSPDAPPLDGQANAPGALRPVPAVKAVSAILIDAVSGQVLYEKNADQPRPMASTTKIMTALLFCEHVPDENALVTASKYASTIRESSLHLKPGEKVSAHDLLRAILMRSANDACVAAAEHVSKTVPAFADLMNQRAQQLGCTHTHFANPNGLQDKNHYTSARDLALIARQAILEPRIAEVTRLSKCRITRSMDKMDVTMRNHNHKFLEKYAGADGMKTGWTIPAGHCFVGSATRDNWRLISVVLKSPDFVHETCALLDYGYANFAPRVLSKANAPQGTCPVANGVAASVPVLAQKAVEVVLPKGADVPKDAVQTRLALRPQQAPVRAGTEVGTLEAQLNGKVICVTSLLAAANVPAAPPPAFLAKSNAGRSTLLWAVGIFGLLVVSLRYYGKGFTTSAKSARRRRRRLTKSMRNAHR